VGDAACVTDPIFGRGMSLALAHGMALTDLVTDAVDADFAARAADFASELYVPWFDHAAGASTERVRRLREADAGDTRAAVSPAGLQAVGIAAARDAVVWHGLTRVLMGLDRPGRFDEPDFRARVRAALAETTGAVPAGAPSRAQLVDVVARARRMVPC
jgi:hypothetical protein